MEQNKDVKKAFALKQILPYYKDPSICGYDVRKKQCLNITSDGRMCVAGKNLLPHVRVEVPNLNICMVLSKYHNDQSLVFIPESVDILTTDEWLHLQSIHDHIAQNNVATQLNDEFAMKFETRQIQYYIDRLGLFTIDELKAA